MTIRRTKKDPLDRYYTPEWATKILTDDWPFPESVTHVWEPCCGKGFLSDVLIKNTSCEIIATDFDKDCGAAVHDFLHDGLPSGLSEAISSVAIVTNPPYTIPGATSADFVTKALEHTPYVAMLLRLTWIEATKDRAPIFASRPPSEIWAISPRVNFTTPDGTMSKNANMISCWFIWLPGTTETKMKWVNASQ